MFRLTQHLKDALTDTPARRHGALMGPVVIWNLVRRCNLTCRHCYAISGDVDFPNELTTAQAKAVIDDLHAFGCRILILSGGEPLMRHDIFELSAHAKSKGFFLTLSTNGTLIDAPMADRIAAMGYDYVGISIDGIEAVHDAFRRMPGAYQLSMNALRLLRDRGVKVGLRFTMTAENAHQLPELLALTRAERFPKFYLSHLVYAGRGNKNRATDTDWSVTRAAVDLLIATAVETIEAGENFEIVTGNNDADAVHLLHWIERHRPASAKRLAASLRAWGGNASGINVANIDNEGRVHPDSMWWHHTIGNVKTEPFSSIWANTTDPLMRGLRQSPRPLGGRCGACRHQAICGGNTRVRAFQLTGDAFAEDPGCYLTDDEIGIGAGAATDRLVVTPFRGHRHAPHSIVRSS